MNDLEKLSYAVAMNFASSIRELPVKLDLPFLGESVSALLKGAAPTLDNAEYAAEMRKLQEAIRSAKSPSDADRDALLAAEKKFFAENGKLAGVVTTKSGLQYQELKSGNGAKPGPRSTVKVHYEGKLPDGKVFDSSIARGEPIEFGVDQVIAGWTEGLQLMHVGAKYRFFIPSALGYGAAGAGGVIPPYTMLIFEVELLGVR